MKTNLSFPTKAGYYWAFKMGSLELPFIVEKREEKQERVFDTRDSLIRRCDAKRYGYFFCYIEYPEASEVAVMKKATKELLTSKQKSREFLNKTGVFNKNGGIKKEFKK